MLLITAFRFVTERSSKTVFTRRFKDSPWNRRTSVISGLHSARIPDGRRASPGFQILILSTFLVSSRNSQRFATSAPISPGGFFVDSDLNTERKLHIRCSIYSDYRDYTTFFQTHSLELTRYQNNLQKQTFIQEERIKSVI
jgi:hypothetical protein